MPSSLPSAPPGSVAPRGRLVWLAAAAIAVAAFTLYRSTLLPGVDFGDSGSFQTVVGSPLPTPRDGYPLYFAIAAAVRRSMAGTGAEPAYALNLTSALEGALACGLFVAVAAELTASLAAAVAGALLFMVSYTFWSQSVTAEVYALHLSCILASTLLLLRWQRRQTVGRLAAFFACYALGFGNHLSMILLLPGFTAFLLVSAVDGWRSLLRWRVVMLAAAIAALGAAQYLWNLRTLWFMADRPASWSDGVQRFWFDVTKADWRDTMILHVPRSMLSDHLAMYWFDLRQQFGVPAVAAALLGLVAATVVSWRRGLLIAALYSANVAFAFSYNVGDSHVFYLPSHLLVALAACIGVTAFQTAIRSRAVGVAAAAVLAAYAGWRGYRDYPALDRSGDRRAERVLAALARDVDDQHAILLADLNWQIANGLSYYTKEPHPEVAVGRARDVLLYAPALVRDNVAAGRSVALTASARRLFLEAYGPLFTMEAERSPSTLTDVARRLQPGTRYALCVLKPTRDFTIDRQDLSTALGVLTGGRVVSTPEGDYAFVAGTVGQAPAALDASALPFTRDTEVDGTPVVFRMESWLAADTIRRMGFGHVVAARRHTLIVERGISFAAFDANGAPIETAYLSNLFADPDRYFIRR